MRVYVALFDLEGNYLIAQKRMTNRWWGGKTKPAVSMVDEGGQYCLPSGEKLYFDSNVTAAERVFYEQTGNELPAARHCAVDIQISGCALVGFVVREPVLQAAHDEINQGLGARFWNKGAPVNGYIVNWELEKVLMVKSAKLHSYLGLLKAVDDSKSGFAQTGNDGASESRRRYLHIAEYLRRKT